VSNAKTDARNKHIANIVSLHDNDYDEQIHGFDKEMQESYYYTF